ncbi:hypothetical protein MTX78_12695 [Hymenobacter tibetensis]|uniref:Uncharacterized protein n=1 Tax=Hymenobacter tibetensis TaxID=497967 RepID=A0ABY4CVE8_9BACT|nr:hypothetical protein [Hymenobacter tibetensis]UOG72986.1 hypothetical protein MTX78_12695 [Hymenobacter tibetensis]
MKLPKTPEDIVTEIYSASDSYGDLKTRQLIYVLSEVADDIVVEGVMQVFERAQRVEASFVDQEVAGRILAERKPLTNVHPESLIERCLIGWNKSAEQFPFWLVEVFGQKIF